MNVKNLGQDSTFGQALHKPEKGRYHIQKISFVLTYIHDNHNLKRRG